MDWLILPDTIVSSQLLYNPDGTLSRINNHLGKSVATYQYLTDSVIEQTFKGNILSSQTTIYLNSKGYPLQSRQYLYGQNNQAPATLLQTYSYDADQYLQLRKQTYIDGLDTVYLLRTYTVENGNYVRLVDAYEENGHRTDYYIAEYQYDTTKLERLDWRFLQEFYLPVAPPGKNNRNLLISAKATDLQNAAQVTVDQVSYTFNEQGYPSNISYNNKPAFKIDYQCFK